MKNKHSVFVSEKDNCLFKEQFELWTRDDWNDDIPPFFKRLNKIDDDRSFVILATSVLEYQIERFLKIFIPKYELLINDYTNFSIKINIIRAFNLIPPQFGEMCSIIKDIRNDFAHNLEIDNFADAEKSKKLPKNLIKLKEKWLEFEDDMCYWSPEEPIRLMFKDIWRVTLEGIRVYESNVVLFRRETENEKFINSLKALSVELKDKSKNV